MGDDPVAQPVQPVPEGDMVGRAGKDMQREGQRLRRQGLRHGEHRRQADATRHEDRLHGVPAQRERVARGRDGQHIADPHHLVQAGRGPAGVGLALDADDIAVGLARRVDQRIGPHQPVGQVDVQMRPGLEARQVARQGFQLEPGHLCRRRPFPRHPDAQVQAGAPGRARRHLCQIRIHRGEGDLDRGGGRQLGCPRLDPVAQLRQPRVPGPQRRGCIGRHGGQQGAQHRPAGILRLDQDQDTAVAGQRRVALRPHRGKTRGLKPGADRLRRRPDRQRAQREGRGRHPPRQRKGGGRVQRRPDQARRLGPRIGPVADRPRRRVGRVGGDIGAAGGPVGIAPAMVDAFQLGPFVQPEAQAHTAVQAAVLPHVDVAVVGAPDRQFAAPDLAVEDMAQGQIVRGGDGIPGSGIEGQVRGGGHGRGPAAGSRGVTGRPGSRPRSAPCG